MTWRPSLIIFDCDGVLVDSEMLSAGVLMAMMAEAGFPITPEIFRADFLGRNFASAARKTEERFGRPLPDDFQGEYRERLLARMRGELRPMAGVQAVIETLSCAYCLATSSSPQRLALSLRVTGLQPYFEGRSFTASDVRRGKPAPDLCLHAASIMGASPDSCLVIEDSEIGIQAAQAAGMRVWHFAGGAHVKGGYCLPEGMRPDAEIADMAELARRFRRLGLC
jgi:HAD superfamily hydrolase (TIGR01509 family)